MRIHLLKSLGLDTKIAYLLAFILLATSQSATAAAKIEHWQSTQGSPVYYVHTEGLPMVDIQLVFDAGSARDNEKFGLA